MCSSLAENRLAVGGGGDAGLSLAEDVNERLASGRAEESYPEPSLPPSKLRHTQSDLLGHTVRNEGCSVPVGHSLAWHPVLLQSSAQSIWMTGR